MSRPQAALIVAAACFAAGTPVVAQPIPGRDVSLAAASVNFSYAGNVPGGLRYDYEGPAVAVVYWQPGLVAMATVGTGKPTIVDLAASGWMELRALTVKRYGLSVPVVLTAGFRRSHPSGTERWSATRLGLGAGLQWAPPRLGLTVRANPTLNAVTSALATGIGFAPGAELDLVLAVMELRPRWLLALGYTFRYQEWNINASRNVTGNVDHFFDYQSHMHVVRVGVRF